MQTIDITKATSSAARIQRLAFISALAFPALLPVHTRARALSDTLATCPGAYAEAMTIKGARACLRALKVCGGRAELLDCALRACVRNARARAAVQS